MLAKKKMSSLQDLCQQFGVVPQMWKLSTQDVHQLLWVADRYGFDPVADEVIMLHGRPYITASGLNRVANRSRDFNGIEVEIVHQNWQTNFFVVKAKVWKKGCEMPFEDFGEASPSTSKMKGQCIFRHAVTRAKARAIRAAFSIPFCSVEELDDKLAPAPQRQQPPTPLNLAKPQVQVQQMPRPHKQETPTLELVAPVGMDDKEAAEVARKSLALAGDRNSLLRKIHAVGKDLGLGHNDLTCMAQVQSMNDMSEQHLEKYANDLRLTLQIAVDIEACKSLEDLKKLWARRNADIRRIGEKLTLLLRSKKDARKKELE